MGRQMMGHTEPREADTAPDTRRTHLKIELSTPTVDCLGKNVKAYGVYHFETVSASLENLSCMYSGHT